MAKKFIVLVFALALIACQKPAETPAPPPSRETIAIKYVAVPGLQIHAAADDVSPVLTTWNVGESVSILAEKGDWVEVRIPDGSSGWTRSASLADSRDDVTSTATEPKFLVPPEQVFSSTNVHGEIVLEASVNALGEIVSIRTISNTTRSDRLAEQNREALQRAKFYPLLENGAPAPFRYTYRVTY